MTRYPRAFKFRRVPAIPPKVVALPAATHTFVFDYDDRSMEPPKPWQDFLRCLRVPEECVLRIPVPTLFPRWKDWEQIASGKGMKMTWRNEQPPNVFAFSVVTITLTEQKPKPKHPSISPKLAATFPWKLRKYLNQKQ